MKTATLPSIRVEPEFRTAIESILDGTETLSDFVESSVRDAVMRRRNQAEFLARGIQSLEAARSSGNYVDADIVLNHLRQRLAVAKRQLQNRPR